MLNYSSRFGTVRIEVMRQSACGGLYVTGAVWMDGLIDWAVYAVTVGLFSDGRSFLSPTVIPLRVKGVWRGVSLKNSSRVLTKAYSRTAGCYGDIKGRSSAHIQKRSCVSSVVGHWPAVSTKHPGTPGWRLADISVQHLMLYYNKIHKLSHICFADVDPEVNVQIMD